MFDSLCTIVELASFDQLLGFKLQKKCNKFKKLKLHSINFVNQRPATVVFVRLYVFFVVAKSRLFSIPSKGTE